jgi:hypothetical protein
MNANYYEEIFLYIILIISYLTLLIRESARDLVPAAWEPPQLESGIQRTDALASKEQMLKASKKRILKRLGARRAVRREVGGDGIFINAAHVAAGAEIVVMAGRASAVVMTVEDFQRMFDYYWEKNALE